MHWESRTRSHPRGSSTQGRTCISHWAHRRTVAISHEQMRKYIQDRLLPEVSREEVVLEGLITSGQGLRIVGLWSEDPRVKSIFLRGGNFSGSFDGQLPCHYPVTEGFGAPVFVGGKFVVHEGGVLNEEAII